MIPEELDTYEQKVKAYKEVQKTKGFHLLEDNRFNEARSRMPLRVGLVVEGLVYNVAAFISDDQLWQSGFPLLLVWSDSGHSSGSGEDRYHW